MMILGIFMACGIGSLLRYFLSKINRPDKLPLGTLLANLFACLLLGYFSKTLDSTPYLILGTGLCGGLSTFSTLQLESLHLQKKPAVLIGYWLLTYGLGFIVLILARHMVN